MVWLTSWRHTHGPDHVTARKAAVQCCDAVYRAVSGAPAHGMRASRSSGDKNLRRVQSHTLVLRLLLRVYIANTAAAKPLTSYSFAVESL